MNLKGMTGILEEPEENNVNTGFIYKILKVKIKKNKITNKSIVILNKRKRHLLIPSFPQGLVLFLLL